VRLLQVINGPEMVAGQGAETRLRRAFQKAQANAPCVLVIDEIDAMAPVR